MKLRAWLLTFLLVSVAALIWQLRPHKSGPFSTRFKLARPYGMAHAAFDGFLRACLHAHIDPHRINQTIGDYPLSVGYHKRDGRFSFQGQNLDYTAAVDLETGDLNRHQIARFLETLAAQGFAAFYREKGKWRGHEHIHAIYAPLPMKPQLRLQVRQWLRARRQNNRPSYPWQKRWKRRWQA